MSGAPPQTAPKSNRRRRILIADDDPSIATMLQRLLSADYDCVVVEDGPGALAAACRPPIPDLVMLDIMMPGLDGLGVAQRLRLLPDLKKVPIIFLTARSTPMDVIKGIQAGARSYITKPFKIADVREKVAKALG